MESKCGGIINIYFGKVISRTYSLPNCNKKNAYAPYLSKVALKSYIIS